MLVIRIFFIDGGSVLVIRFFYVIVVGDCYFDNGGG